MAENLIHVVFVSEDNFEVVLNQGKQDVKRGDVFLVFTYSKNSIVDPVTGDDLGKLEIIRGKGKVINVQEKICTIRSIETKNVTKHQLIENSYNQMVYNKKPQLLTYDEKEELPFKDPEIGDYAKPIYY